MPQREAHSTLNTSTTRSPSPPNGDLYGHHSHSQGHSSTSADSFIHEQRPSALASSSLLSLPTSAHRRHASQQRVRDSTEELLPRDTYDEPARDEHGQRKLRASSAFRALAPTIDAELRSSVAWASPRRWLPWLRRPSSSPRRKKSEVASAPLYEPSGSVINRELRGRSKHRRIVFILAVACVLLFARDILAQIRKARTDMAIPVLDETTLAAALLSNPWWSSADDGQSTNWRERYSTPVHTLSELEELHSHFESLQDDTSESSERARLVDLSSLHIVVDCSDPTLTKRRVSVIQEELARHPSAASNVSILVASHNGYQEDTHPLPLFALSTRANLSQILSSRIWNTDARFTLLVDCPSIEHAEQATRLSEDLLASAAQLLRVAGTDEYANSILTTSGISLTWLRSLPGSTYASAWSSTAAHDNEGSASTVNRISETIPFTIATGVTLLPTKYIHNLEGLDETRKHQLSSTRFLKAPGVVGQISFAAGRHRRVRTYGLPLPLPKTLASTDGYLSDLVDRIDKKAAWSLLRPKGWSTDRPSWPRGHLANIAVFLATREYTELQDSICALAKGACGHEVTVYDKSRESSETGRMPQCPDVRIAHSIAGTSTAPGICIAFQPDAVPKDLTCTPIVLDTASMAYLEWLGTLPKESLASWNEPTIDLVVLTNNRPASLHRLLSSLRRATYLGDRVNLYVNIEQTADDSTSALLRDAEWPFGSYNLRRRILLGGLMPAVVESWYPSNDHHYAIFLEDDVEVSPHFYQWAKMAVLRYRYGSKRDLAATKAMFGISLYQPKHIELRPEGRRRFDAHRLFASFGLPTNTAYLSQIPCSWGAVYFPEHWREFHQYLSLRLGEVARPLEQTIVADVRSNRWPRSWKKYMIEMVHLRGYTMLYPNFSGFRSLSTNHLEIGTHVKDPEVARKRRQAFEVPLLGPSESLVEGLPDGELPCAEAMPVLDFWGSLTTSEELRDRGRSTREDLQLCGRAIDGFNRTGQTEEGANGAQAFTYDASELLCEAPASTKDDRNELMRNDGSASGNRLPLLNIDLREAKLREWEATLLAREARLLEREADLDNWQDVEDDEGDDADPEYRDLDSEEHHEDEDDPRQGQDWSGQFAAGHTGNEGADEELKPFSGRVPLHDI